MATVLFLMYLLFTLVVLYNALNPLVWELGSLFYLTMTTLFIGMPWLSGLFLWSTTLATILLIRVPALRELVSDVLYSRAEKSIPKLSRTEEEALNAGDTWLEEDIFKGSPDWERLREITDELTLEERAFIDNETETLCAMLDDWEIKQLNDLPENIWNYIKDHGFFGLVISKEFGGKGFSARAHSEIVMKIASRSGAAAVTVMVPNSLGPGELLQYYGTEEQKAYHLPRLAKGIDIPCFALTEPSAGSDATSLKSEAIVSKRTINGKVVLGLTLSLNKRWITLAPVATLIGLAVNLQDPDELLQGIGGEGITCLLIPRDTEHLEIGNRHIPAEQAFMNGTVRGNDIFVPINCIIGGQSQAGRGWQMLVECLSIGRSISLPALGTASSLVSYLTTGAFARIRRQFNVEIAQFEGVEEKLAEIAGLAFLVYSTRLLTVAAVNQHKKPSVASAITKYFNTELARIAVGNAMDVHAGRGVIVGPRNYLYGFYQGVPISVTVEGANIMSRNLLIFGQGSMACHPFIRDEFYAVRNKDKREFNKLLWQHIAYSLNNLAKTILSAITGGLLISVPKNKLRREYQRLSRLSYAFAWIADLSLVYLGGSLKRKERLSARLADALSFLYMAMGALRLAHHHEQDASYQVHAKWAVTYCFYQAQKAMIAFCQNFPVKSLGFFIRLLAFPLGQTMRYPSDRMDHQLARLMVSNNEFRNCISKSIYVGDDRREPIAKMEQALQALIREDHLYKKVADVRKYKPSELTEKLAEKVAQNEITQDEMRVWLEVEALCWDAMQVDEFSLDSMQEKRFDSLTRDIQSPFTVPGSPTQFTYYERKEAELT